MSDPNIVWLHAFFNYIIAPSIKVVERRFFHRLLAMPQNLCLLSLALATASLVLGAVPTPLDDFKPQFVKTIGTQFTLDGSKFTVVGCGVVSRIINLRGM